MAIINVALTDTFDQWRTKTNTLGTNQGDLASLDAGFTGSDLVSCLNELRAGEEFTKIDIADSTNAAGDGPSIRIGDGDDLLLYHDGSNSFIKDAGTGALRVLSSQVNLSNAGNTADYIVAVDGGAVTLAHNGASKIATTATGVNVTGEVDMDTLKMPDNTAGKILVGDNTSYEEVAVSGDATLASSGALTIGTGAVTSAKIADNTIVSADFNSTVTLNIRNSSGTIIKTLRSPGS
tara:strand:- start:1191 stop:1898 length:708 start_codon:yes stop_codon:yes gene_type:complete